LGFGAYRIPALRRRDPESALGVRKRHIAFQARGQLAFLVGQLESQPEGSARSIHDAIHDHDLRGIHLVERRFWADFRLISILDLPIQRDRNENSASADLPNRLEGNRRRPRSHSGDPCIPADTNNDKPKDNAPPKTAPKVNWDDSSMDTTYANVMNAASTREEVILLFGMNQSWKGVEEEVDVHLTNRVILNPYAAKRLAILLGGVVTQYEKRFGALGVEVKKQ
jgi:hypothetical protein